MKRKICWQLIAATHPKTGLYAFVAVFISFNFYQAIPFVEATITAATFCFATWSIMSFNDIIDRDHDKNKGKSFAADNFHALAWFCAVLTGLCFTFLLLNVAYKPEVSMFGFVVLLLGIGYSFLRKVFLIQNWIVALCSASPWIVGGFYHELFLRSQISIAIAVAILIAIKETYLDIRDRKIDKGYKHTLSSENTYGYINAALYAYLLLFPLCAALIVYSQSIIWLVAIPIATIAVATGFMFTKPEKAIFASRVVDLIVLLIMIHAVVS